MAGTLARIPPDASNDYQIAAINQAIDAINAQQRTQVQSDTQNSRFLFGYQLNGWPGGSFGLKISLPGYDVTTATAAQLLFSWDFTTGTQYWYDATNNKNYMQMGKLPDNTYGWATAASNKNVSEGF